MLMTKVLIVDDSEFFREIYQTALTQGGFEVETAENGQDAMDKMLASPPHLIFLDLVMPVMTGEEVLSAKQKHDELKNIPVVMLTSIAADVKGAEVMSAGPIVAYFTKDKTSTSDIINKAKEVLGTSEKRFEPTKSESL
jgi:CheY-like chemotaxis protein